MRDCKGINLDGTPCRNLVRRGEDFCYLHKNQARRKRKPGRGRILAWSALLVTGLTVLSYVANITGVLGFFGISLPLFHKDIPTAGGNSVTIGRDMKDSTIIQSQGDVTVNENPSPVPTAVEGITAAAPLPQETLGNRLFLPVVYNSP